MTEQRRDYDNRWKDIRKAHFAECIAFFFPNVSERIDWARGYESLNTELQQIARDAKTIEVRSDPQTGQPGIHALLLDDGVWRELVFD